MVKFIEIPPEEVPDTKGGGRGGRVYYPILKSFLETGHIVAKIDKASVSRKPQTLYQGLTHHIRQKDLPIKIFTRQGDVYLMRRDINPDGSPNPEWQGETAEEALEPTTDVQTINADVIRSMAEDNEDSTQ